MGIPLSLALNGLKEDELHSEFQDSLGYMLTVFERRGNRDSLGYMLTLLEEKKEEGEI